VDGVIVALAVPPDDAVYQLYPVPFGVNVFAVAPLHTFTFDATGAV
jgi:hypothetical protein